MVTVRDEAACAEYIKSENEYVSKYGGARVTTCPDYYGIKHEMTILFRLTVVISIVSGFSLIAAWIMNMYEGRRKDLIRPLKIVAVSLAGYDAFYFCLMVMTNFPDGFDKMGMLAGFASSIWFLVMIVAWVISHNEKVHDKLRAQVKKDGLGDGSGEKKVIEPVAESAMDGQMPNELSLNERLEDTMPRRKSDEELRAEIEEQVRREMIEKQVREKLEKEMEENGHL